MANLEFCERALLRAKLWSDPDFLQFVMGEPHIEDANGEDDMDKVIESLDGIMAKYIEKE